MTIKELFSPYYRVRILEDFFPLAARCSFDSELCKEVVEKGWLTDLQMFRIVLTYNLGKSRNGKTIYWMTDEHLKVRDGHVGNRWISDVTKEHKLIPDDMPIRHCLFGQHLLTKKIPLNEITPEAIRRLHHISIVEKERSAAILSELFPQSLWLASCYPANLNLQNLQCLQGRCIRLFPATDPLGATYQAWYKVALEARLTTNLDITIDDTLEKNATDAQREACSDILDYVLIST